MWIENACYFLETAKTVYRRVAFILLVINMLNTTRYVQDV